MLHTNWIYLIDSCCLLCSRHFGRWTIMDPPIWIHRDPWWMRLSCLPWKFPVKPTYRLFFLNHLYFSSIPEDCSCFSIGKHFFFLSSCAQSDRRSAEAALVRAGSGASLDLCAGRWQSDLGCQGVEGWKLEISTPQGPQGPQGPQIGLPHLW